MHLRIGVLAAICSFVTDAHAGAGDFDAGLYTGLVVPGPNHELYAPSEALPKRLSPGPALGGRFSYRPIGLLAGELEAHGAANSVRDAGGAFVYAYRAQALVLPPIQLPADLEPFLTAGLGNIGVGSSTDALGSDVDWAAHAGLGSRLPLSDVVSLRADLRLMFADRNVPMGSLGGHTEFLVGVNYRIGPAADRDGDGITDRKDSCEAQAETVNGHADLDGCPDELATVTLAIVDSEGLPADNITVYRDGLEIGRTDIAGRVTVEGLMPDSAVVLRGEHFHMERPEETTVTLVEGANEANLQMEWRPGRVRVVTLAEGDPMVGATAAFAGPKQVAAAPVQNGDQTFYLSPGEWQVLVTAETYGTELLELSIAPDERSLIVIEMALEPARVEVTREEVRILQQILFDTGSTDVQGSSLDLVKEVTGTVLATPHIKRIQIQGHTDSQGPASFNRKLSQSRVETVMQWMVDHGVSPDMLEAKGFGEDEPVAPNTTEEGRALNRRVVFLILEQDLVDDAE